MQKALRKFGLVRAMDFALHVPLRYEDETRIIKLSDAASSIGAGGSVQIEGTVTACEVSYRPRRQLLVSVDDGSGVCTARFFNFYPSQIKALAVGNKVLLRGELKSGYMGSTMLHPAFKAAGQSLPDVLTPVYPTSGNLPQAYLRRAVQSGLERARAAGLLTETLPAAALQDLHNTLRQPPWPLAQALHYLHHPTPDVSIAALEDRSHPAWLRLKAEELLAQQLSQAQARQEREHMHAPALPTRTGGLHEQLLATLPFHLTTAQRRVSHEIAADLARPVPMHRLLQGDVGSGKTIVAALAALTAIEAGAQVAVMAPTEILAEQHYLKFKQWLEPLGLSVAWLSGSQRKKAKAQNKAALSDGLIQIAVGTHALFQDDVQFQNLGLVIVDEQHRFGVAQRLALKNKGADVHQLMMSATPIPRTLAMSFFADLDVSVIDELPPGRTPIKTRLVNSVRRSEVEGLVLGACRKGQQAYWVCPLIEESETLQLQTATETQAALQAALPELSIGLVHGRMKAAEKAEVMAEFSAGRLNVLVATTVIEVGVDVPNAALMVIEHAERMGLAQLHQLRGRVGRGAAASACVLLFAEPLGDIAKARLKVIYEHTDGFEIARQDLNIRGPGEFLGARQSGVPMLRFANLEEDLPLLEAARNIAPQLIDERPDIVEAHLARWLASRESYLGV